MRISIVHIASIYITSAYHKYHSPPSQLHGQPKVCKHDVAPRPHKHVLQFDVPVGDASLVQVGQAAEEGHGHELGGERGGCSEGG